MFAFGFIYCLPSQPARLVQFPAVILYYNAHERG